MEFRLHGLQHRRYRQRAAPEAEALIYPEAVHSFAGGDGSRSPDPRSPGSPQAEAAARQNALPKVVAFLAATLQR
ncbi:MAG: hypothetical protein EON93_02635 [Burkholderiales bacterium]|nr:MAG: hypothetical protein EON93_02635 [Burkholderiales bacterium]